MNAMSFNTLDAVRRIEAAGIERLQAEAIVDEIAAAQEDLFTKADGQGLEDRFKADIETLRLATRADIESAKAQLIMWLVGAIIAINGAFSTVLFFALRR